MQASEEISKAVLPVGVQCLPARLVNNHSYKQAIQVCIDFSLHKVVYTKLKGFSRGSCDSFTYLVKESQLPLSEIQEVQYSQGYPRFRSEK